MSFSLYCSPRSLSWFLMLNLCLLFLLLLHHLPLLINFFTIRWILIFIFLLQLLLYFRYQYRFGFRITNGLIIIANLSFLQMRLPALGLNGRMVCLGQNVLLLWCFYRDQFVLDKTDYRSMQLRIEIIVYQELLY